MGSDHIHGSRLAGLGNKENLGTRPELLVVSMTKFGFLVADEEAQIRLRDLVTGGPGWLSRPAPAVA